MDRGAWWATVHEVVKSRTTEATKLLLLLLLLVLLSRFSRVRLFATLWTVVPQAPLSVGFSRQEYWSGCHFLLQGIFQTQGSNPRLLCLLHWQVGPLPLATPVYLQSCTV